MDKKLRKPMLLVHLSILGQIHEPSSKGTCAWIQLGRWIKYEEKVEQDADRLGRPQIPIITLESVQQLRILFERNGQFLPNVQASDLEEVMEAICQSTEAFTWKTDRAHFLQNVLLADHYYYNRAKSCRRGSRNWNLHDAFVKNVRRNSILVGTRAKAESGSIQAGVTAATTTNQRVNQHRRPAGFEKDQKEQVPFISNTGKREFFSQPRPSIISMDGLKWLTAAVKDDDNPSCRMSTEIALVLIGQSSAVRKESISIGRLAESILMPELTPEVNVPVRFICLILAPSSSSTGTSRTSDDSLAQIHYKEIGRSISTLLANPEFQSTIYNAESKQDLLESIDHFLSSSVLVPPGSWDPERMPFDRLKTIFSTTGGLTSVSLAELRRDSIIPEASQISKKMEEQDKTPESTGKGFDPSDSLHRTGKLFGGLCADICRRYPLYWSDIKDGLNLQCLATILFVYFACVSGNIAFGGLMSTKTENYIGISETLMAASVGGTIFALLSGQPMLIVGTTGPMLVFDESLFKLCKSYEMSGHEFLVIRSWIGIWLGLIALTFTCFDGSASLKFFTRFTQEIFATLISFVFIVESIKSLLQIYKQHPLLESNEYFQHFGDAGAVSLGNFVQNETQLPEPGPGTNTTTIIYSSELEASIPQQQNQRGEPNIALLSTILMFGTYLIATALKDFRNSGFFNSMVRNTIANFAVLISIIAMAFLDYAIQTTSTPKLKLPDASDGLKNSHANRSSWFISPFYNEFESTSLYLVIPLTVIPAGFLFIFIFMETGIAELIVGKKEAKLRKGGGYHLNVLLMVLINTLMGLFGLGWVSAPTVRSVAHATALTVYSVNNVPGEKPETIGALEQRLTAFFVSFLIGISVLMADILIFVPLAVLFGIFLFMGVTSLQGVQLVDRTLLLFKPIELHPQVAYILHVRRWKMSLFTCVQLFCLVVLWCVKESPASLSLALCILLLVPLRFFGLKYWFSKGELAVLDGAGGIASEKFSNNTTPAVGVGVNQDIQEHV